MYELLDDKDQATVQKMLDEYGKEVDGYFNFWRKDELQLDGDFSLPELKLFVKILEKLK